MGTQDADLGIRPLACDPSGIQHHRIRGVIVAVHHTELFLCTQGKGQDACGGQWEEPGHDAVDTAFTGKGSVPDLWRVFEVQQLDLVDDGGEGRNDTQGRSLVTKGQC